jgi:hypothetical protein
LNGAEGSPIQAANTFVVCVGEQHEGSTTDCTSQRRIKAQLIVRGEKPLVVLDEAVVSMQCSVRRINEQKITVTRVIDNCLKICRSEFRSFEKLRDQIESIRI